MKPLQYIVSKVIFTWMIIVIIIISYSTKYSLDGKNNFYRFGPNKELKIMGLQINNYFRYFTVISYCFINSGIRTLYYSILKPWLINNIQDETKIKEKSIHFLAYEITVVSTIYIWFDWLLYMNILLSQIDLILVEIVAELFMSLYSTKYYLQKTDYIMIT